MNKKILVIMLILLSISCFPKTSKLPDGAKEDKKNSKLNKSISSVDEKIPLGINIDWATDWNNMAMFTNTVKQARGFGNPNEPWKNIGQIKLDENGWPIEDFGIAVFTGRKHLKDKVYNITFNTNIQIALNLVATNGRMYDLKFDDEKKLMTAKIFLPKVADQLMISFKNTDKGIKNLKIVDETNDENTLFTPEFLEMHRGFGVLRFMELQNMNKTTISNWSDQSTADDIFQNQKGLAWEYAIDLCNELNADIWVNVPVKATDDYIRKLAQLLNSSLNSDLKIYVEYSNEPWNLAFSQNAYLKQQGQSNGITAKNDYFIAGIEAADRLKKISDIFGEVFGNDSINSKIRPVLGAQLVWPDVIESQLQYIEKTYGSPNKYFYAFAGGAYVSGKSSTATTLDEVYNLVHTNIENSTTVLKYRENMTLANKYNLRFVAYEGGIDIVGQDFKVASEITKQFIGDSRMGELIGLHLNNWYEETNNSLFMWYKSGASPTWGLTDSMDNMESEKIKVMKSIQSSLN